MRYLHATTGKYCGRRNIVRLIVAASCLSSQVYSAETAPETSKQNVGITFKNGKVELPPAALPGLPVSLANAETKPNAEVKPAELPSSMLAPTLPSLPSNHPATLDAPKLELPPPPLPTSMTQPKEVHLSEAPVQLPASLAQLNGNVSASATKDSPAPGKVTVKLGDTADSQPISLGNPSLEVAGSSNNKPIRLTDSDLSDSLAGGNMAGKATAGPMKFTLDDNGVIEHAKKTSANPPVLQQRAPELVRPARGAPSKIVALPPAKDPGRQMDRAAAVAVVETDVPSIVSAPALPTSRDEQFAPQRMLTMGETASRMSIPAPSGQIAIPNGGAVSASFPATNARAAVDAGQDRVFDIEVLGTCNMVMSANVTSASSKNADICSVFHNGTTLTVVGNMPGRTSIEVQMANGQRRMLTFKVVPAGAQHAGPSKDLERVMQLVTQHFPASKVDFTQDAAGSVILKGTASSEADARKILELVRKVCLVPVEDKIFVVR